MLQTLLVVSANKTKENFNRVTHTFYIWIYICSPQALQYQWTHQLLFVGSFLLYVHHKKSPQRNNLVCSQRSDPSP